MPVHHDQVICPGRRMNRLGDEHVNQGQSNRKNVYPETVAESPAAEDPDERAAQMAAEQGPRLGCRCAGKAEEKHAGAAERSEQERRGRPVYKPKSRPDSCSRPYRAPRQAKDVPAASVEFFILLSPVSTHLPFSCKAHNLLIGLPFSVP